jgi:hypothetical protein
VAQQGTPPRRSARPLGSDHQGRHNRSQARPRQAERPGSQFDAFGPDSEDALPPWAGPSDYPVRSAGRPRSSAAGRIPVASDEDYYGSADGGRAPVVELDDPPGHAAAPARQSRRGRAAATRLRKSRRRVYRWCGIAIVVCVIAAGITAILTHHSPKPLLYVTSLQPGEFKAVPSACGSVSGTVLSQYLPQPGRTSISQISSSTDSQCSFTLDHKPDFLVLELTAQAYQPFAAATEAGSPPGSASANAADNFTLTRLGLAKPAQHSPLSPAQISTLAGIGQQAFVATQTERATGIATELVTVVVRERNVLITVAESGQESGHGFGPVSASTLQAGAEAAARDLLAKAETEPKA